MIEIFGDLWTVPADARCITTNGVVNVGGIAVMGRGCAREAAERYPTLPKLLGAAIRRNGNHVVFLDFLPDNSALFSFPVKVHWRMDAELELITRSALELVTEVDRLQLKSCILPRPGCGNGRLNWQSEVRPVLAPLLDDRFKVITNRR